MDDATKFTSIKDGDNNILQRMEGQTDAQWNEAVRTAKEEANAYEQADFDELAREFNQQASFHRAMSVKGGMPGQPDTSLWDIPEHMGLAREAGENAVFFRRKGVNARLKEMGVLSPTQQFVPVEMPDPGWDYLMTRRATGDQYDPTVEMRIIKDRMPELEPVMVDDPLTGVPFVLVRGPEGNYHPYDGNEFTRGDLMDAIGGVTNWKSALELTGDTLAAYTMRKVGIPVPVNGAGRAVYKAAAAAFQVASTAGGTLIGGMIDDWRTNQAEYTDFSLEESFERNAQAAAMSGAGDAGARVFFLGVSKLMPAQGHLVADRESMLKMYEFAEKHNLPLPVFAEMHTLGKSRMDRFFLMTSIGARVQDRRAQQLYTRMTEMIKDIGDVELIDDKTLMNVTDTWKRELKATIANPKDLGSANPGNMQEAFLTFDALTARRHLRNLAKIEEMSVSLKGNHTTWDLSNIKARLPEITARTKVLAKKKKKGRTKTGQFTSEFDFFPIAEGVETSKKLETIAEEIMQATDKVITEKGSGYNALHAWRRDAKRIMQDPSQGDEVQRRAAILLQEIEATIKKPIGGRKELRTQIAKTEAEYQEFSQLKDMMLYNKILTSENASTLVLDLYKPHNVDNVALIKQTLTKNGRRQEWNKSTNVWMNNLVDNGADGILELLDPALQSESTRRFVDLMIPDRKMQEEIRQYAFNLKRFETGKLSQLMNYSLTNGERVMDMIKNGSDQELLQFVQRLGGRDTPAGRAVQAGVLTDLFNRSTGTLNGKSVINYDRLKSYITELKTRGYYDQIFSKDINEMLDGLRVLVSTYAGGVDVGQSLARAELGKATMTGTNTVLAPWKYGKAKAEQMNNYVAAQASFYFFPGPRLTEKGRAKVTKELLKTGSERGVREVNGKTYLHPGAHVVSPMVGLLARSIGEMERDRYHLFGDNETPVQVPVPTYMMEVGTLPPGVNFSPR